MRRTITKLSQASRIATQARCLFRGRDYGLEEVLTIEDLFVATLFALFSADTAEAAVEHLSILDLQPVLSQAYLPQITAFLISEADGVAALPTWRCSFVRVPRWPVPNS